MKPYTPPPMPGPSPPAAESDPYLPATTETVRVPRLVSVCAVITAVCAVLAVLLLATIRAETTATAEATETTAALTQDTAWSLLDVEEHIETMALDGVAWRIPRHAELRVGCWNRDDDPGEFDVQIDAFTGGVHRYIVNGKYTAEGAARIARSVLDYYDTADDTLGGAGGRWTQDCSHIDGWRP